MPTIRYPHPVRIAVRPIPTYRVAAASDGEWLVDPNEWFTEDEGRQEAVSAPTTPNEPTEVPAEGPKSAPTTIEEPAELPGAGTPRLAPEPAAVPLFTAPLATSETAASTASQGPVDPHLELFAKNAYPSARECATCHEDIYHEWSISAHAYAAVSPMFHKFEQKLNDLSQGTVGYFCMRCHAPVATALCASRDEPIWNLPEVAREGITCIACHRVQYIYGKSNGERRIEPGDIFAPVFGGIGGDGVAEVIHRKDQFKVKTSPDEQGPGQDIHVAGIYFEPLTRERVLHALPPGGRAPGHQARSGVGAVPRVAGLQEGHPVPGLPHGPRARPAARLRLRPGRQDRRQNGQRPAARNRTTSSTARTIRSPTPACSRST